MQSPGCIWESIDRSIVAHVASRSLRIYCLCSLVSRSLRVRVPALAVPFSLITFPHACRKRDRHQLSVDFSIFARRFHVVIREIACATRDLQPLSKFSRLTSIRNEAIPRGGFTRHVAFEIAISFRRSPIPSLIPSRFVVFFQTPFQGPFRFAFANARPLAIMFRHGLLRPV